MTMLVSAKAYTRPTVKTYPELERLHALPLHSGQLHSARERGSAKVAARGREHIRGPGGAEKRGGQEVLAQGLLRLVGVAQVRARACAV